MQALLRFISLFIPKEMRPIVVLIILVICFPVLLVFLLVASLGSLALSTPLASDDQYDGFVKVASQLSDEYKLDLKWEEMIAVYAGLYDQNFSSANNDTIRQIGMLFIREEKETYSKTITIPVYLDGTSPSVGCDVDVVDVDPNKDLSHLEEVTVVCTRTLYIQNHLSEVIAALLSQEKTSEQQAQLIDLLAKNLMEGDYSDNSYSVMPANWWPTIRELLWPVPDSFRVTSLFGSRMDPIEHRPAKHNGIDIGASTGTTVVAVKDGTVTKAGYSSETGITVVIAHGDIETRYYHLSRMIVAEGQHVSAGQKIGEVGSTGRSTGPHLHFEVRKDGIAQNPLPYYQGLRFTGPVISFD